jgi:hypothetical protein
VAKNISFKDFMDQVEMRLEAYSPEALQEIIMDWAKNSPPSKRNEFLSKLTPVSPSEETSEPDEELLEEIGELAKRVESGDYCNGWGWDDAIQEERDWGDESWADEADEFFSRAHEALTAGYYQLAKDAYARLFDILEMGEEPGHLPGAPDSQDMLDTDLGEARAGYLRSVYLSSGFRERPVELLRAMQRFRYHLGDELNLQSVVNVERKPLPEFTQFLPEWIYILKKTDDRSASNLLREAVMLSGGTAAIAKLAHDEGNRYPSAYVNWIKALEKDEDFRSMLKAAKEGLSNVPRDYAVRAEIAEGMVRAGERLHDIDIQLVGWHEAFYSHPSLSYLLSLLSVAEQKRLYREEIEAAITRIALLLERGGKYQRRSLIENIELQESSASGSLLNQAYLLAGRCEDAFDLCQKKEALGWSFGRNPEELVIPFFLVLLSKGKKQYPAPNLEKLWKESLNNMSQNGRKDHDVAEHFERAMDKVIGSIRLSGEEENKYLRWCIEETGQWIDKVVGEKQRYIYDKAATLLVALAEMLANRDRKSDGVETIEKYRQKYRRYSAFIKELNKAI